MKQNKKVNFLFSRDINVPTGEHQGSFGAIRKHDIHTGIDLYCEEYDTVHAIENGIVVSIVDFTGSNAESPWWNDTKAVLIESNSGVILYGEIDPSVSVGQLIQFGDCLGAVRRVLRNDKGLPTCMLHLELYTPGTTNPVWWRHGESKPENLLDPTKLLNESAD